MNRRFESDLDAAATVAKLEALVVRLGYSVDVGEDGTRRLIRPDGTIAVIARKVGRTEKDAE